jgi:hypothetical protein
MYIELCKFLGLESDELAIDPNDVEGCSARAEAQGCRRREGERREAEELIAGIASPPWTNVLYGQLSDYHNERDRVLCIRGIDLDDFVEIPKRECDPIMEEEEHAHDAA